MLNPLFTNNKVKYLSQSKWPVKGNYPEAHFSMCELWHWPLRYMTQVKAMVKLCKVTSRSNMAVRINESSKDISFVCTVTLALVIWPGHVMFCPWTTILWNIIKIQLGSKELWPDTNFWYVCIVTLTLETLPCVNVMTHPWVMDNNCVKCYPNPHSSGELWPGHRF